MLVTHLVVTFGLKENPEQFIEQTIDAFQVAWNVIYKSNTAKVRDEVGAIPWQKAFYVAGELR